jgi:glycerol-3-phosphate acyltransferase PlsY
MVTGADLFYLICSYVIGSVPIGFLVARYAGVEDIRQHGSGNIGATNVARLLGKQYFFLVLFLDALRAAFFLSFLHWLSRDTFLILLCAVGLLIGNCYSVFLYGDGGKGVATLFGIACVLSSKLALLFFCVWSLSILLTRTASLAALISVVSLSVGSWYMCEHLFFFLLFAMIFIMWRHYKNIQAFLTY